MTIPVIATLIFTHFTMPITSLDIECKIFYAQESIDSSINPAVCIEELYDVGYED